MKLWLSLVCLATVAAASVTPGPGLEAPPQRPKPTVLQLVPAPADRPGTEGYAGTTSPPPPGTGAHPNAVPSSAAALTVTEAPSPGTELATGPASTSPSPTEPEGPPEAAGTPANGTTATPVPVPTEGPTSAPVTTAPPCPGDEEPAEVCGEPTGEETAAVAEALSTFALRFYQRLAEATEPSTNLLFSPINVALGLSHLLLGARGETRERLGAVLAYPPEPRCVHRALRQLAKSPGLLSASQIFHHGELRLAPRFLEESRRFYDARPRALSGNESLDLRSINKWVREATQGRLPRLLDELPPEPRLVLLSAVYFQAKWKTPFQAKDTMPQPFLRPGRSSVLVPTMTSKKYPVASFSEPGLRALVGRLQLSQGVSLVVVLPPGAPGALQALEAALSPAVFLALLRKAAALPPRPTVLALPRFRLDRTQDVVAVVHEMDYGLFLDAELCGLAPGREAAVDAARHRAVLALDEAGVEAAGALATSLARTANVFEALRPFLFVLWDDARAFPLFMGRLSDPQP
ncbi:plasma protease C1 inhibitor [Dromaius novaehollandiae]|uniref:plasma protease C1 inhibitor n=1 Tax=Dromaius novaehollandiae TaxID=8790 RepID=UPI00311E7715